MRMLLMYSILTFSVNVVIKSLEFKEVDKHCTVLSREIDFRYKVFYRKRNYPFEKLLRVWKMNWVGCVCLIVVNTLTVEAYFPSYFNVKACACVPMYVCAQMCLFKDFFIRTKYDQGTTCIFFFFFFSHFYTVSYGTIRWLTEPQMSNALQNPNYTRAIFHSPELFTGKEP